MHIVDITMFYAPQSGGVKRYLRAKRAWLSSSVSARITWRIMPTTGSATWPLYRPGTPAAHGIGSASGGA